MYSLIVTAQSGAWNEGRYALPESRFGEYTAEQILDGYEDLGEQAISKLQALPTLLAYEQQHDLPARLARVTRIRRSSGAQIRFEYQEIEEVPHIPRDQLLEMVWDLDINDWELNRTHWAMKDVDLLRVLRENGISVPDSVFAEFQNPEVGNSQITKSKNLLVRPKVFDLPEEAADPTLASVMMPLAQEFDSVYTAIRDAVGSAGLHCRRADDLWQETVIIQEVVNLIWRSAIVIVDLTHRNPNVLYEMGIAHTLGREVIPISQEIESVPFDLRHHRVCKYFPNDEGLEDLRHKLKGRLRYLASRE